MIYCLNCIQRDGNLTYKIGLGYLAQHTVPVLDQVSMLREYGWVWLMTIDNKMLCRLDDHISYVSLHYHLVRDPTIKSKLNSIQDPSPC